MSKEKSHTRKSRRLGERARSGEDEEVFCTVPVRLPFGVASAVLRKGVLHSVEWENTRKTLEAVLSEKFPGARKVPPGQCKAGRLLLAYAGGERIPGKSVAAIPVDWHRVRGFGRKVLEELARVPYGETVTYGELASRAGRGKAARAVGMTMARNPWPVIIPCHRVVGAGGKLVGFGKGVDAKRTLLAFEEKRSGDAAACPRKRQNG